ncbi:hypothetical protein BDF19DRAFT_421533 [Syncephalis fuscata]|nr:hypothetical protein BDF19DRAFT_421533 [Syncephalis fuscata]
MTFRPNFTFTIAITALLLTVFTKNTIALPSSIGRKADLVDPNRQMEFLLQLENSNAFGVNGLSILGVFDYANSIEAATGKYRSNIHVPEHDVLIICGKKRRTELEVVLQVYRDIYNNPPFASSTIVKAKNIFLSPECRRFIKSGKPTKEEAENIIKQMKTYMKSMKWYLFGVSLDNICINSRKTLIFNQLAELHSIKDTGFGQLSAEQNNNMIRIANNYGWHNLGQIYMKAIPTEDIKVAIARAKKDFEGLELPPRNLPGYNSP